MAASRSTDLVRASQVAGEASAAAAEVAPKALVEPDLTGAAFFDVDNTVMRDAAMPRSLASAAVPRSGL